ncbi:MAG: glutamine--tRNA ligase/YqeY domain fusion protein [Fluviicoccus sp.]|uniref:glutamine--tRNA ligase/YqeY domain fusion protein n=1 Tax=Fluviicoccus sp. TaxID=2003552 RepID=UPI002722920D|nr:glutamine--tRNA ligase/YqeY domain fusion protein [Fluviicoccus sp.]MDO8329259.1 glutamine--tRNA ligase/YqeY domain fusion protein [Fluviicoccus sp.]
MEAKDFIRTQVVEDLASGKHSRIITRFPPEPNGYLHIGHAKSICLNFGVAAEAGGECNLRFDDTNPEKEEQEYIDAIKRDVHWLGFDWAGDTRYASNYFDALYDYAVQLIRMGKAYVDSQSAEAISQGRSTLNGAGLESPFRNRTVEENLSLFEKMRAGDFNEGECVLRAKVDMASPNINLRDPVIYRIKKVEHHQTGNKWVIYPMYDYTHPISDALEYITHSLCTLEFEDHRPFYDWLLDTLATPAHPQQIEFSRLNLNYTVTSKRKLKKLVDEGHVHGWDDPRMPTIAGLRRRGYTPESLRDFCDRIGITKSEGVVDVGMLEFCIRNHLENTAPRAMAVLNPLKVVVTNIDEVLMLRSACHPNLPELGEREIPFTREIVIDAADFSDNPPKGFKRLVPGGEVRLRHSYVIRCDEVIRNESGDVVELRCSADLDTLGKNPEGRKVKGVIHWVSASAGVPAEVRLYDRLFTQPDPEAGDDGFLGCINSEAFKVVQAMVEPSLANAAAEDRFQFEREGYFVADLVDTKPGKPVFNRTVGLRDSWGGA